MTTEAKAATLAAEPSPAVVQDPALTAPVQSLALAPIGAHPVAAAPAPAPPVTWDAERHRILTDTIMPKATPAEVDFFKLVCARTGLDPFAKQIHAVKRNVREKDGGRWMTVPKWSFQVAIDGFRLIAQRTGKYRGQTIPLYCGDDGVWVEVWLKATPPRAAKVGVLHADFDQPLYAVALWSEYVQTKDVYEEDTPTGQKIPAAMWAKMPSVMIAKVAEALALRKAFPQELSGLYTNDEMAQADSSAEDEERTERRRAAAAERETSRPSVARQATVAFTNGTAMIYPYGPLKQVRASLDAVYDAGATKTKKGKDGAPDETLDVAGQFVVSDKRLEEALGWCQTKLRKHREAEEGDGVASKDFLEPADLEKITGWAEDIQEERDRRATLASPGVPASESTPGDPVSPAAAPVAPGANGAERPARGTHGSPALEEDARKLEALGADAGPTREDLGLEDDEDDLPF